MHVAREVPQLRIGGDEHCHGVQWEAHTVSPCLVAEFHCVETEGLEFENGHEGESQKLCQAPEFHQRGQPCYNFSFSHCNSGSHVPTYHAHACQPTTLSHSYLTHHLYDHMALYVHTSLTHTLASPQLHTLPCVF